MLMHAAPLCIALVIDAIVGYPCALHRRVRHPVVWMGALIEYLEARWNRGSFARRRAMGCLTMGCLIGALAWLQ